MLSLNLPNPGHFPSHFFRTNLHVELSPPQTPQRSRLISESNSLPQDTRCLSWKKKKYIYISAYLQNQIYPVDKKSTQKNMKYCAIFVLLYTLPECRRLGLWDHWSISSHSRRLVVEEKHQVSFDIPTNSDLIKDTQCFFMSLKVFCRTSISVCYY